MQARHIMSGRMIIGAAGQDDTKRRAPSQRRRLGWTGWLGVVASAAIALTLALPVSAETRWMDDGELRAAFSGRTIDGRYSDGTSFVESYFDSGRLDYREDARRMVGRWLVVEGTFCTLYDNLSPGGCFKVRQVSANCFEFYFAAADDEALAEPPGGPPRWTAQAWITDRPSTCQVVPAV